MTSRDVGVAVVLATLMVVSVVAFAAPVAGAGSTGAGWTAVEATGGDGAVGEATAASNSDKIIVNEDGGSVTTITQGIFEAEDGDRVEVRPGTYEETVFVDKNVTLVAPQGATLDGSSLDENDTGIRPVNYDGVVVEGFTVENYGTGVEIEPGGGSATLRDLTVRDNDHGGVTAGFLDGAWVIEGSTIEGNGGSGVFAYETGTGQYYDSSGDWRIEDTAVRDNGKYGLEVHGSAGDWEVVDATVEDNADDGVLAAGTDGDWTIRGSEIRNNGGGSSGTLGFGVTASGSTGNWTVAGTTIANNDFGVWADDSTGAWSIVSSNVSANTHQTSGGESGTGVRAENTSGAWAIHDSVVRDQIVGLNADESSGAWRVRNANVTENAIGVFARETTGAWTIHRSGIDGNDVNGVDATDANPAGDATNNWWGQAAGPRPDQCVGNVVCDDALTQSPNQEITDCTVVDYPGTYEVQSNVSADETCIEVTASHVTIEGQGHALDYTDPGNYAIGVYANGSDGGLTDVTVTNLDLSGWSHKGAGNSGHALLFEGVADGEISRVDVSGGDHGIHLLDSSENELFDNTVAGTSGGQAAVLLQSGSNRNAVRNTTITQAGDRGLLLSSSRSNTLRANEIYSSGDENVRVAWGSNGNVFVDNVVHGTSWGDSGISVGGGGDLVFRNNTVTGSAGTALGLSQSGSGYLIEDNTFEGNGGLGLSLKYVGDAVVRNNTVTGNGAHGIRLKFSGGHVVENNTVVDNGKWGINLNGVSDSAVTGNTVKRHPKGGVLLKNGASNNEVTDNLIQNFHVRSSITFPNGIELRDASDNRFSGNAMANSYRGVHVTGSARNNSFTGDGIYSTGSGTHAVRVDESTDTTVDSLDIGDSTAPNTTLSFEASNVTVGPTTSAPANPDATAIGRFLNLTKVRSGAYLNATFHYDSADLGNVDESTLSLWHHDGSTWTEISDVTLDTGAGTVRANVTVPGAGTIGVFGERP